MLLLIDYIISAINRLLLLEHEKMLLLIDYIISTINRLSMLIINDLYYFLATKENIRSK